MLRATFNHIPGLGATAERSLWKQGCFDWTTYLDEPDRFSIGGASRESAKEILTASHEAQVSGHHQYFARALSAQESWRAWPDFKHACVYLDIETDGGQSGDSITTIGMYDGTDFIALIKGKDIANFRDVISRYSMIVTFFGTGFDLPMLKKAFPDVIFDQIHLDLCFALRRLGIRGGLKKIEKQFGISRGESDGLTGMDAIRLWRRYLFGDEESLRLLIEYNREDVVNLETLAGMAYKRLKVAALAEAGLRERDTDLAKGVYGAF